MSQDYLISGWLMEMQAQTYANSTQTNADYCKKVRPTPNGDERKLFK